MKRLVLTAAIGLGAVTALGFYVSRTRTPAAAPEPMVESTPTQTIEEPPPASSTAVNARPASAAVATESAPESRPATGNAKVLSTAETAGRLAFNQAIETVTSTRTTFDEKKAAWKKLRREGRLDPAITELEGRSTNDPGNAQNAAALGEAYLQKCASVQDIRERSILAMKADQVFDTALTLDPSNWEARFNKADAMTYWPPDLKVGPEVIEQFNTLIQMQQTLPSQPNFVQPYVRLGDFYQKTGHGDEAMQTWRAGVALFPNDPDLSKRLTATPAPASANN